MGRFAAELVMFGGYLPPSASSLSSAVAYLMEPTTEAPSRKQLFWGRIGIIAHALGVWPLFVGIIARGEEDLNRGGIRGPRERLARADDPLLFNRITYAYILLGLVLFIRGLLLADRNTSRTRPL
ncbi:MAG TPA: hypothetical protein VGB92_12385 [Longimicrobium sp.]|jgi:hypothetical protein